MKDYVQIQSEVTIEVNPGLLNQNMTKEDSDIADRLKINPIWPKFSVLIKKGQHIYPSEVADWHSVKMLVKNKLAIVGQYVDDASSEVAAMKKKLENAYRQFGIAKPEETDKKVEEKKSVRSKKENLESLEDIIDEGE